MTDLECLLFLLEHCGVLGPDPHWRRTSDAAWNAYTGKRDHYCGFWRPDAHQRPPAYTMGAGQCRRQTELTGRCFGPVTVVRRTNRRALHNRAVLWLCSDGHLRQLTDLRKMARRAA